MADISRELAKFRSAAIGEDVRGSMISAFIKMNEEASHAEAWATGGSGGTPTASNNAQAYATQANARGTAWAEGVKPDGSELPDDDPAKGNSAKDWAEAAAQSASELELDDELESATKAAQAKAVGDALAGKVDAVSGKGLSENDFSDADKAALDNIAVTDNTLSVAGKAADAAAVGAALDNIEIELDDTLTQPDMAADAKAVGDRLDSIATFQGTEITSQLSWTNNYAIRSNNGKTIYSTSYAYSNFVSVAGAAAIRIQAIASSTGEAIVTAGAFYSAADETTFVSKIQRVGSDSGYAFVEILVPSNANYVRFTKYKSEAAPFRAFIVSDATDTPENHIRENETEIDSVRADLEADLAETNGTLEELKDIFDKTTGNEMITGWTAYADKGINLKTGTDGVTYLTFDENDHVVPTENTSTKQKYIQIPASEGDQFTIRAKTSGQTFRTYAFVQADGYIIDRAASAVTLDFDVLTAPSKTAWLIVQDMRGTGFPANGIVYRGRPLVDVVRPICEKIPAVTEGSSPTPATVHIYVPTSNNKYYIHYMLTKSNRPDYVEGREVNYAVGWRLNGIDLCNLAKKHVSNSTIMSTGEWEMGIALPQGTSTVYLGLGNHGYEMQVQGGFSLFVDGKEIGEDDLFDERPFEEIQLINKFEMYDPRLGSTLRSLGYHTRIDTINGIRKTITVENKVEFTNETSETVNNGMLFMLTFQRTYNAHLMTDQFIDNYDYLLTDCSTQTFAPDAANHGVGEKKPEVTEYKFWGSYLDVWGYAKILRRETVAPRGSGSSAYNLYKPASWVENYVNQNKIYMSICRAGDAIAGDIWRQTTEFFFDSGYDGNPVDAAASE